MWWLFFLVILAMAASYLAFRITYIALSLIWGTFLCESRSPKRPASGMPPTAT